MKNVIRSIVAAVLAFSAISANATSYSFEFLSQNYEVDGIFTVADTLNTPSTLHPLGSYDILGISGIVWGDGGGDINGLVNNPNQPNVTSGFGFFYDNVLPLDVNGVLFTVGTGSKWNLYKQAGTYHLLTYNAEGLTGRVDVAGTFTTTQLNLAPVPEPETYAMMLAGLGLLGVMARRRKQKLSS